MNKTAAKLSKKEEQKKLAVRIICIALAALMVVSSLGTVIYYAVAGNNRQSYSIEDLLEAGIIYQGEDGNYYYADDALTTAE